MSDFTIRYCVLNGEYFLKVLGEGLDENGMDFCGISPRMFGEYLARLSGEHEQAGRHLSIRMTHVPGLYREMGQI